MKKALLITLLLLSGCAAKGPQLDPIKTDQGFRQHAEMLKGLIKIADAMGHKVQSLEERVKALESGKKLKAAPTPISKSTK